MSPALLALPGPTLPAPFSALFGASDGSLRPSPAASSPPGLASSTSNIYTQSDVKCVYIYENQRWNPVTGYSSR